MGAMMLVERGLLNLSDHNGFWILFSTAEQSRAPWRLVHLSNAIASAFL
jgi:hypothetical protein